MTLSSDNNTNVERILKEISLGDKVTINDWENFMEVVGISPNYIALFDKKSEEYSIICKNKRQTGTHNEIIKDTYYCGPDDRIFGYYNEKYERQYDFNNPEWVQDYLMTFENGDVNISEKQGCTIHYMKICHEYEVLNIKGEL